MDHLRQGIGLRAYAQRNPKQEYKRESFQLFETLLDSLKYEVTRILMRVEPMSEEDMKEAERRRLEEAERQKLKLEHEQMSQLGESQPAEIVKPEQPYVRSGKKVGRNDPCPCGSGKKFKSCHGALNT